MQLVDELSMIYTTCLMMHASFSYSRSQMFSVVLGVGLLSLAGSITVSSMQLLLGRICVIRGIGDFTLCEPRAETGVALLLPYQGSHLPPGGIRCFDGYRRFSEYLGDGIAGPASLTRPRSKTGLEATEYDVGHGSYWCVTLKSKARLQGSSAGG